MTALMWFSLDLRLQDLPALTAAARHHEQVIPVYILDDHDPWRHSGASLWWLHHSLKSLQQSIQAQGGKLILRRGATEDILTELCEQHSIEGVYCSRAYEPWLNALQQQLHKVLPIKRYSGRLLLEPDQILNQQGRPFQVFTPYSKNLRHYLPTHFSLSKCNVPWSQKKMKTEKLTDWGLQPRQPDWAARFKTHWSPGEAGALNTLTSAIDEVIAHYQEARDLPAQPGTSRLSPHLHFGEISPRQVYHQIRQDKRLRDSQREPFLRQIIWREFSHYLLHHWPQFPEQPFRPNFAHFPWRKDQVQLRLWQQGRTGYPIVDAGMRQLWQTGWMHNRVRMIVASFLCKHLRLPWQWGAKWFWDTLVDADLANNSAGWQWVAGCGADAAPYFRIFNPVLQGEKFDANGDYIKQWLPELAGVPPKYIHKPWLAPSEVLEKAGLELGVTYATPIVEHKLARQAALDAFAQVRQSQHK